MKMRSRTGALTILSLVVALAGVAPAQTFTTVLEFDYALGGFPEPTALLQGSDGEFYGTTFAGGVQHIGTVFKVTSTGTLTSLDGFQGPSNAHPTGGLVLGTDGDFYGTTSGFGFLKPNQQVYFSAGTIFKITPAGIFTTLYTFCNKTSCADGSEPHSALIQTSNGNFYGTTTLGGANTYGTVFEMTPGGKLTTIYSFCAQAGCADGARPFGSLILAANGNFYGTTYQGGANGGGTVFELTPAGVLTTLCNFGGSTGRNPYAGLAQGSDGNFYGTTYGGGAKGSGTVFRVTPQGTLTTLYSFSGVDGANPYAGLVQASDGNFYGATLNGGSRGHGALFEITTLGEYTKLYDFCSEANCADGAAPRGGLVEGSDGNLYGTTQNGGMKVNCPTCGTQGEGTVFSVSLGLAPGLNVFPFAGK